MPYAVCVVPEPEGVSSFRSKLSQHKCVTMLSVLVIVAGNFPVSYVVTHGCFEFNYFSV